MGQYIARFENKSRTRTTTIHNLKQRAGLQPWLLLASKNRSRTAVLIVTR
jgi:hypothetical protein